MHHPTDRIAHTTAFVTPVVEHWLEREIPLLRVEDRERKRVREIRERKNERDNRRDREGNKRKKE